MDSPPELVLMSVYTRRPPATQGEEWIASSLRHTTKRGDDTGISHAGFEAGANMQFGWRWDEMYPLAVDYIAWVSTANKECPGAKTGIICNGHGVCDEDKVGAGDEYVCKCSTGFEGKLCNTCSEGYFPAKDASDNDDCDPCPGLIDAPSPIVGFIPCNGHGVCANATKGKCVCAKGYSGTACDGCYFCGVHGTCVGAKGAKSAKRRVTELFPIGATAAVAAARVAARVAAGTAAAGGEGGEGGGGGGAGVVPPLPKITCTCNTGFTGDRCTTCR